MVESTPYDEKSYSGDSEEEDADTHLRSVTQDDDDEAEEAPVPKQRSTRSSTGKQAGGKPAQQKAINDGSTGRKPDQKAEGDTGGTPVQQKPNKTGGRNPNNNNDGSTERTQVKTGARQHDNNDGSAERTQVKTGARQHDNNDGSAERTQVKTGARQHDNNKEGQVGTLLRRLVDINKQTTGSADNDRKHIMKWAREIKLGCAAFIRELARENGRVNAKPVVFAVIANGTPYVQLAHGFGQVATENDDHEFDGHVGCFFGDRAIAAVNGELVIQDPTFVTLYTTNDVGWRKEKPAPEKAIVAMTADDDFIPGSPRTGAVDVPILLPLPVSWAPYFLTERRRNKEAFMWIHKQLGRNVWKTDENKECAALVLNWFKAACTSEPRNVSYSWVDITAKELPRDEQTLRWTMAHLGATLPRPKPPPRQEQREVRFEEQSSTPTRETPSRTDALLERVMALSSTIMQARVDTERTSETAKKMSEVETCRLLGFCGLGWHEKHLLPKIWAELKKQPDRMSREAVLSAFFQELAEKDPSLLHFKNQALFDDIINHHFTPGDTYETCHKGLSPLAFLPRTHAEVHNDNVETEYYEEATTKTVGDVRKHRTKGPPEIPTNDAELLRLNNRDVVVMEALFTKWSSLVIQEKELNEGLRMQQMDLFSHPDATKEMIPTLLWAKIKARRQFFSKTCTRTMLEGEGPDDEPTVARAQLSAHTMLILMGAKVSLVGIPSQWLSPPDGGGPTKRARHNDDEGPSKSAGRYGKASKPWETTGAPAKPSAGGEAAGINPAGPPVFADSKEVNELLKRHPKIPLTKVANAAGFRNAAELPTEGLPKNVCLLWICFGRCNSTKCERTHPATVDSSGASKLYKTLLPGITKILEGKASAEYTARN